MCDSRLSSWKVYTGKSCWHPDGSKYRPDGYILRPDGSAQGQISGTVVACGTQSQATLGSIPITVPLV